MEKNLEKNEASHLVFIRCHSNRHHTEHKNFYIRITFPGQLNDETQNLEGHP